MTMLGCAGFSRFEIRIPPGNSGFEVHGSRMVLQLPVIPPAPESYHLAEVRIRRCTFRRLVQVDSTPAPIYDVECLFPERRLPIPLGDLEIATPICNACTAAHIFRPDED